MSGCNRRKTTFQGQNSRCLPLAARCLEPRDISNDRKCFIHAGFYSTSTVESSEEKEVEPALGEVINRASELWNVSSALNEHVNSG
jgi:hypothetical protein